MICNFQVSLEVSVAYLLKEDVEFVFDLFGLMEEIELVSLILGEDVIDELLELLWTWFYWHLVDSEGLVAIVYEFYYHIFGKFYCRLNVLLYFFCSLHSTTLYIVFYKTKNINRIIV